MTASVLEAWHRIVKEDDWEALKVLLAEDAVFHSPVVHTPQRGRELVLLYLSSAAKVLGGAGFRYVREVASGTDAALEFEAEIDGIHINGVDLIRWNDAGKIVDFKVMVRPLKAVNLLHRQMKTMLEEIAAGQGKQSG
ncbi:MAG: nuclear transport factor 2 family protein [bacterium]